MKISEAKQCIMEFYIPAMRRRASDRVHRPVRCGDGGSSFIGLKDRDTGKMITRYLAPQFLPSEQTERAGLVASGG